MHASSSEEGEVTHSSQEDPCVGARVNGRGLFLEHHPFKYAGFLLAGAYLSREYATLRGIRKVFEVLLPVENFKVPICHFLDGFRNGLLNFVV